MSSELSDAVNAAVKAYIITPAYKPPALPPLGNWTWQSFAPTELESRLTESHAARRRLLYDMGASTLDRVVFLILLEDLARQPAGYANTLKNAVVGHTVLRLILHKVHPNLVKNVGRVDSGFYIYLGALWDQEGRDDSKVAKRVRPMFHPLLEVGGRAYRAFGGKRNPSVVVPRGKRGLPADLQFAYNAREVHALLLTNSPPQARNMYESSSEEESFEDESEISVQVDIPLSAYQEQLVKSSPERFSTQVMVTPNSTEDIHEDIYDWEKEWIQSGILPESSPGLPPPPQVLRAGGRSSMGFAPTLEMSLDAIPAGALVCIYVF
ncbi:hypothetical protein DFH09DRAFT_1180162 [Mycena vulgaris]|nr:hypothetical protein DFH09DRAFT_1180162 [Mycena vulgaris]